jgi:hypothetical protein
MFLLRMLSFLFHHDRSLAYYYDDVNIFDSVV